MAYFVLMVMPFLIGCGALSSHSVRTADFIGSLYAPALTKQKQKNECIAFDSQHKSASNTITSTLRVEPLSGARAPSHFIPCDQEEINAMTASCKSPATVEAPYVLAKGFVLTMADQDVFSHDKCQWLTMFREPISRLVSAFYYCKRAAGDPLCGSNRLHAANATIEEWASHWGNFLFRELLLYPPIFKVVMPETGHAECNALCEAHKQKPQDMFWYKWKIALAEGQTLESKAGKRNLQLVKKYLRGNGAHRIYDVFGITTEWAKSMWLFDQVAPLHASWADLTAEHYVTHGSEADNQDAERTLQAAKQNEHVLRALEADLHIYTRVVVPLFYSLAWSLGAPPSLKANLEPDLS